MITQFKRCISDEDMANVSLFIMNNRRDMHPAYSAMDTVSLLCSYMMYGHLLQVLDADNRVIGASAYYHGTMEEEFTDKEIALVDLAIFAKSYRGTRQFSKGLGFLVREIIKEHPEVQEMRLVALSENAYVCKLYSKFAEVSYKREGAIGEETVFCVKINDLNAFVNRFNKV